VFEVRPWIAGVIPESRQLVTGSNPWIVVRYCLGTAMPPSHTT
jgi:hypothetical protein